jgi:hypothetical protein
MPMRRTAQLSHAPQPTRRHHSGRSAEISAPLIINVSIFHNRKFLQPHKHKRRFLAEAALARLDSAQSVPNEAESYLA